MTTVKVKGIKKVPVDENALIKLINYFYNGKRNLSIEFTNKIRCYGTHQYNSKNQTHFIQLSPQWCKFNRKSDEKRSFKKCTSSHILEEMNNFDCLCRIINSLLHEMKHAIQCDRNPIRYAKCEDTRHERITNESLAYELSPLESEAEGWALINFDKALKQYEKWVND